MDHPTSSSYMELLHAPQIYKSIADISQGENVMAPLVNLPSYSRDALHIKGLKESLRSGRYKQKVRAQFQVINISLMVVPVQTLLDLFMVKYSDILLFQHQARATVFDIYVCSVNYASSKHYDNAVLKFVTNICGGQQNLAQFSFIKGSSSKQFDQLKAQMMAKTGYELSHQLIKYQQFVKMNAQQQQEHSSDDNDSEINANMSISQSTLTNSIARQDESQQISSIIMNGNKVFDIQEFARGCIKVMENLMFFTQNDFIRQLQLQTNQQSQINMLRLLDHRPIIREIWDETLEFALHRPGMKLIADSFHNQQRVVLFNCNKQAITNTFNLFSLGNKGLIVQPHPVRAMLDYIPYLEACTAFDIALYDFRQYGLNWLISAYCVGKNFLTHDFHLTNNMGAICFVGAPGSGKSRISNVLFQFMNGFMLQDIGKGIAEFQNYDIVSKSFIKAEEINLQRLAHCDWKVLADIEQSMKCRIKNAADVEIGKNVPVVITSNGDVFSEIIQKLNTNFHMAAAHRRWAFIRYSSTWNNAHTELLEANFAKLSQTAADVYATPTINHELMNSLIACALLFKGHQFVQCEYIIPYYTHVLVEFSQTIYGQILLQSTEFFENMT